MTDVCYPTPSELAQCDSQCQRGAVHRPAWLWKPEGLGKPKGFLFFVGGFLKGGGAAAVRGPYWDTKASPGIP